MPSSRKRFGIVGSRTFADPFGAFEWLDDNVLDDAIEIISGGAAGADRIAEDWALSRRWLIGCAPRIIRPDKSMASPARYHIRNTKIVEACDHLIAFWDGISSGTASTIAKAKRAGRDVTTVFFGPHQLRAAGADPTIYIQGPSCKRTPPLIRLPMDRGKSRGRWWSICGGDVEVHGPGLPTSTSGIAKCLVIPAGLPTSSLGEFKAAYQDRLRRNHLAWPGNLYAAATADVWTTRDHLFNGMPASVRLRMRRGEEVKVTSGDSLVCTCSDARVEEGKCHRVWAAEVLAEMGWRVILDGVEQPATAPGRLGVEEGTGVRADLGGHGLRGALGGGGGRGSDTARPTPNGGVAHATRQTTRGANHNGRRPNGNGRGTGLGHVSDDNDAAIGHQCKLVDLSHE